ncbi:hypothetical protein FYJ28_16420 [Arthrobacter sp. BL-252-APC-1A]|nr:hypothetical protein [Arthrobacter sp. BL-252-APC-1A]
MARTSMAGLRSAQAAATQWAAGRAGDANVLGLVLVADAPGKLPRPLRDVARLVSGGVPRTWSIPWIEAWRVGDIPSTSVLPRDLRRLLDDLNRLTRTAASAADK